MERKAKWSKKLKWRMRAAERLSAGMRRVYFGMVVVVERGICDGGL